MVTGSPHKIALEETDKDEKEKERKKQAQLQKSKKNSDIKTKSSAKGNTGKRNESKIASTSKSGINDEDAECLYCSELYLDSREEWVCYQSCGKWAHKNCSNFDEVKKNFILWILYVKTLKECQKSFA